MASKRKNGEKKAAKNETDNNAETENSTELAESEQPTEAAEAANVDAPAQLFKIQRVYCLLYTSPSPRDS